MGYDITIGEDMIDMGFGVGLAIVGSHVLWVAIISKVCLLCKVSGIILATFPIDHARRVGELRTTGTMQHGLGDSFI
jgi:hypothetical protein